MPTGKGTLGKLWSIVINDHNLFPADSNWFVAGLFSLFPRLVGALAGNLALVWVVVSFS